MGNKQNHQNLYPQSQASTPNLQNDTESWTDSEKKEFFVLMTKLQLVLKTYGKQSEDIGLIADVFLDFLSDFEPEKVIDAFKRHIRTSPEFPTPSDIIKIIQNKTQDRDKPNHQIYRELCLKKRNGEGLSYLEEEYKKSYETFYLTE